MGSGEQGKEAFVPRIEKETNTSLHSHPGSSPDERHIRSGEQEAGTVPTAAAGGGGQEAGGEAYTKPKTNVLVCQEGRENDGVVMFPTR
jgi:hypothetical protein